MNGIAEPHACAIKIEVKNWGEEGTTPTRSCVTTDCTYIVQKLEESRSMCGKKKTKKEYIYLFVKKKYVRIQSIII